MLVMSSCHLLAKFLNTPNLFGNAVAIKMCLEGLAFSDIGQMWGYWRFLRNVPIDVVVEGDDDSRDKIGDVQIFFRSLSVTMKPAVSRLVCVASVQHVGSEDDISNSRQGSWSHLSSTANISTFYICTQTVWNAIGRLPWYLPSNLMCAIAWLLLDLRAWGWTPAHSGCTASYNVWPIHKLAHRHQ